MAIFPDTAIAFAIIPDEVNNKRAYYQSLIDLELPERIRIWENESLPGCKKLSDARSLLNQIRASADLPKALVLFGETVAAQEEVTYLFCPQLESPVKAFDRVQNQASIYLARP